MSPDKPAPPRPAPQAATSDDANAIGDSATVRSKLTDSDQITLHFTNHQHIHENIKFADQKAAFVVTLDTALLGIVYSLIDRDSWRSVRVGIVVCLTLAIGIACAVWVVRPRRGEREAGTGVIDAERIALHGGPAEHQSAWESIAHAELIRQLRSFTFRRAQIDRAKYVWLKRSLVVSAIGWLWALFFALGSKWAAPSTPRTHSRSSPATEYGCIGEREGQRQSLRVACDDAALGLSTARAPMERYRA